MAEAKGSVAVLGQEGTPILPGKVQFHHASGAENRGEVNGPLTFVGNRIVPVHDTTADDFVPIYPELNKKVASINPKAHVLATTSAYRTRRQQNIQSITNLTAGANSQIPDLPPDDGKKPNVVSRLYEPYTKQLEHEQELKREKERRDQRRTVPTTMKKSVFDRLYTRSRTVRIAQQATQLRKEQDKTGGPAGAAGEDVGQRHGWFSRMRIFPDKGTNRKVHPAPAQAAKKPAGPAAPKTAKTASPAKPAAAAPRPARPSSAQEAKRPVSIRPTLTKRPVSKAGAAGKRAASAGPLGANKPVSAKRIPLAKRPIASLQKKPEAGAESKGSKDGKDSKDNKAASVKDKENKDQKDSKPVSKTGRAGPRSPAKANGPRTPAKAGSKNATAAAKAGGSVKAAAAAKPAEQKEKKAESKREVSKKPAARPTSMVKAALTGSKKASSKKPAAAPVNGAAKPFKARGAREVRKMWQRTGIPPCRPPAMRKKATLPLPKLAKVLPALHPQRKVHGISVLNPRLSCLARRATKLLQSLTPRPKSRWKTGRSKANVALDRTARSHLHGK
eukprot:g51472.t1